MESLNIYMIVCALAIWIGGMALQSGGQWGWWVVNFTASGLLVTALGRHMGLI